MSDGEKRPWWRSSTLWIFIGLALGVLLGGFFPQDQHPAVYNLFRFFSKAFIALIKGLIVPLLLSTIVVGIAQTGDIKAVDVGQAEVQHDDIGAGDLLESTLAGAMGAHLVALTAEGAGERLGDGGVVLNEKHCRHGRIVGDRRPRRHRPRGGEAGEAMAGLPLTRAIATRG